MSIPTQGKIKILQESISDSSSDEEENVNSRSLTGWALKRHKNSDGPNSISQSSSASVRFDDIPLRKLSKDRVMAQTLSIPPLLPASPSPSPPMEEDMMSYPVEEGPYEEEGNSSDVEIVKDLPRFTRSDLLHPG
ncbi:hypothetical protein EON65_54355, partial [archaeon]